jgi:hypothetical protein
MDKLQADLDAIRQLLSDLTRRVYRIERSLGLQVAPSPTDRTIRGLVRSA